MESNDTKIYIDFFANLGAKVARQNNGEAELQFYHSTLPTDKIRLLNKVPEVTSVIFYVSDISDENIAQFQEVPSIKKLGLYSCHKISDSSIELISKIPNLNELSIIDTNITSFGKSKLKNQLPSLVIHSK